MEQDERNKRKSRTEDMIRDLDEFDVGPSFLPSAALKRKEEKKQQKELDDPFYDNSWIETLENLRTEVNTKKKIKSVFDEDYGKKKKKKKKKDGEAKDYTDEFEKEVHLLEDLLVDQTRLSHSLQERYNTLDRQKSSTRGVGKFTTDLITTLNASRSLCKDTLKEIVNIKKTVAELNMKEREKFAKKQAEEGDDVNQFASSYLKKIMSAGREPYSNTDFDIDDVENADDVFGDLVANMENSDDYVERSAEADQYIKYENQKITVKVLYNESTDHREFFAVDEYGNMVDDYPLPSNPDKLNINRTTHIATDIYGQRFPIEYN